MDLLIELYRRLPSNGEWTDNKRAKWLNAVEKTVDWLMSERRRKTRIERATEFEICELGRVSLLEQEA